MNKVKIGILSTHPIQYYTPLYRVLTARSEVDLTVYYAHRPTAAEQGDAGFGVAFEWDIPLLDGYKHVFLNNRSARPNTSDYRGCDTPEIADVIRRESFDAFLVLGWYTRSHWQAMRACWQNGTPLLVRGDSTLLMARGRFKKFLRYLRNRLFIPHFDGYLIVGQRAKEYLLAFGADPSRMEFCPHFVDNDCFSQAAEEARLSRAEIRRSWGLADVGTVFVFAGKFIPKKRPLDFVKAVAMAAQKAPGLSGLMVGDGPLRPDIEAAIRETGAPIRLTGFLNQTQIHRAYAAGDVVVLPSNELETWGLVVNEAMACGLPAVVSDRVGCAVDLVVNEETGFVYKFGDVGALARILNRLSANTALMARLGVAARTHIADYSVRRAADGLFKAVCNIRGSHK